PVPCRYPVRRLPRRGGGRGARPRACGARARLRRAPGARLASPAMSASVPPPTSRRFEREVRNVLVGGLVFALFLAGASLVVMRNTTRWAARENAGRARSAEAALSERLLRAEDARSTLAGDARAASILTDAGALAAALYDAEGDQL